MGETESLKQVSDLRVAFVAGGLEQGGAEKQLVYMTRALQMRGAQVRVYSLTDGDPNQAVLEQAGVPVTFIGQSGQPFIRMARLMRELQSFKPHILQSTHFFANLYAAVLGRALGIVSVGSVRSNGYREVKNNGSWGPLLLRLPKAMLVNSEQARRNLIQMGRDADSLFLLPNVVDLEEFASLPVTGGEGREIVHVITVARLVPVKRLERFLAALAAARAQSERPIQGIIAGDGPERANLEARASELGLGDNAVTFLGARSDVPVLLGQSDLFVLTSQNEGFPNAILEAMAACLPVITTPAGDAPRVVEDGISGYVVPHEDVAQMARRMVELAADDDLRRKMGQAGRERVEREYSFQSLGEHMLKLYEKMSRQQNNQKAMLAFQGQDGSA